MNIAETWIQKMMDDYDEEIHPKYYIMDAGYDKPELYANIYKKFRGQVIVPINWRNTKITLEGIDIEGQLLCVMNYLYIYVGDDNGIIRLLGSYDRGKCDCAIGAA